MNYADYQCLFCGLTFEELAFYGCCARCYSGSEKVRAIVDSAYPQTNAFAVAKQDAMNAEAR